MTEETSDEAREADAGAASDGARKDAGRKGRILMIALGVAAIGLAGGGAAAFWWQRQGSAEAGEKASATVPEGEGVSAGGALAEADPATSYIEVAPMMVNLRGGGAEARFVKLRFIVVAADGEAEAVRARLPIVLDALQPFLRELRPDDLNGSAAVFRIKEEMLRRAAQALGQGMVRDILIQDLIQQ